jgi:DNA-directed RNA polymerase I, II, and III subunit RPABC2
MSDLEEVSDNELMDKMTDSPEISMKLSKKKKEEDEDDVKSEEESEKDITEDDEDDDEVEPVDVDEDKDKVVDEVVDEVEPDDEDEDEPEPEETEPVIEGEGSTKPKNTKISFLASSDEEDEDEDDEDEDYLQKFDKEIREDFVTTFHPESKMHNYEEINASSRVTRNSSGIVSDVLHKTLPFLTKYEMTRVLGQRARQINAGAKTFVVVPPNIIDGYLIAKMELEQKKIPFIIKRPLPNGCFEYWNVSDLEII